MSIEEKIRSSIGSTSEVHLYKEGVFWVAYEQSAYWVWQQKNYKATKKFVKLVGLEVVSVGFPASVLNTIVEISSPLPETESNPTHLVLSLPNPIAKAAFTAWKNSLTLSPGKQGRGKIKNPVAEARVINQIRRFDLANATPMDCMQFLAELKQHC